MSKSKTEKMLEELAKAFEPGMTLYTNDRTWYNLVKANFPDAQIIFTGIPLKTDTTSIMIDIDSFRKVDVTSQKIRYYGFYNTWDKNRIQEVK